MKNKEIKFCNYCGKKIRNAWRRNSKHHFCNPKCYHQWRTENHIVKGRKQDWNMYRKLKWLVEKKNESFTNRV